MKNKITYALLAFVLPMLMHAQSFDDAKTMNINLSGIEMVHMHNFKGDVTIKGTNASQGKITFKRKLKSASRSKLNKAKDLIYLDTMIVDNELYFFIESPDRQFKINADGSAGYNSNWQGDWNVLTNSKRFNVESEFTIVLELPKSMKLMASVHHKDLKIEGVENVVRAGTHHGSVDVKGLRNDIDASSHHGDVTVQFDKNPQNKLNCHTHHGDITVAMQSGFSADVSMKSHHGAFYTDFDYKRMPSSISKKNSDNRGTKYKIGGDTKVRIGDGDVEVDFSTHHGDVFITK